MISFVSSADQFSFSRLIPDSWIKRGQPAIVQSSRLRIWAIEVAEIQDSRCGNYLFCTSAQTSLIRAIFSSELRCSRQS